MKRKICVIIALLLAVSCLTGCGKSKEVKAVEKSIKEIGEVTKENETQINYARAMYEALSEEEQKRVSNYDVLEQAERDLQEINRLAIVGMWQTSFVGIPAAVDFRGDGTYEIYVNMSLLFWLQTDTSDMKGNYTFDGVNLQLDESEELISIKITGDSMILSSPSLKSAGYGDLFFTRYE